MRPDRIIVGEVRGGETLDMIQAMNTGHDGSLVTVHANSADDSVYRLQTLASMSDVKIAFEAVRDQIYNAIDVIVALHRGPDGTRRIMEVAVGTSPERGEFALQRVAHFEAEPIGPDRVVRGEFRHHRLPTEVATRLFHAGESVPPVFGVGDDSEQLREVS
jgi:pilus assembly protein CpaF